MPADDDAPAAPTTASAQARREPRMGWLGDLDFRRPAASPQAPRVPHRWRWIAAIALLTATATALTFRKPLADRLWPEARAQELRQQAAQALSAGRLSAGDGSGARELYEAAIAIDPDRNEARTGLVRVGAAAVSRAEQALRQNRFADAHADLALARALSVPRARTDAFANRLREREADVAGIDAMLARAAQARAQGRLEDPGDSVGNVADAALPLYKRVLELQPQRIEALEGREDAIADLLQRATVELESGKVVEAAASISAARGFDPGHAALPAAVTALAAATDRQRSGAERDLRRGKLAQAAQAYRALLQMNPQDAVSQRGLEGVARAYAARAETLASDYDFRSADAALRQARSLAPTLPAIAAAQRHVDTSMQSRARLAPTRGRGNPRRVQALLREAGAAEARGDLLTPPGDSAYDKIRAARALAPDDAAVARASARLLPAARRCFERGLSANDLGRARVCLDAMAALGDASARVAKARRRLAERWLAVAGERLRAGAVADAESALRKARDIDAGTAGIDDFERRLRTATASGD